MMGFKRKQKKLKKMPKELKDVKEIAMVAFDNIAEGILVLSRDFKIIWANKKIMSLTKLKESEVIGNFCYKITHHSDNPCQPPHDICPIHEVLKTGKPITVLHTHFDKEGNEFYAEISVYPIKDGKGEIVEFMHIARDVTERVKAEKALAEAKDYTDNIIESIVDTLLVINPDATIKTVNRETCELLGYGEDELLGKPVATISEEEDTPFKGTGMKKLIEKSSIRDYDMTYKAKSGEKIPVSFSGSVMRDKERELVGIVGIARDMREIKRLMQKEKELAAAAATAAAEKKRAAELDKAYKQLKEMQDMLIQAEKLNAVGQLASGIAHEVRNPMGIIKQGVDYLEGKLPSSEKNISEVFQMIKDNIERSDNIIRTLVDFSRASKLQKKLENINSILESSLILIQHRVKLEDIKIVKELEKGLPKILVDKGKLEQVFINIFLNAIQAMPRGGKLFICSYLTQLNEPKNGVGGRSEDHFKLGEKAVVAEIEDTGAGISEENLKKIFDPFFTTKEIGKGSGLGLSVIKNIIVMHKGLIEIKSKIGKGTKVIITLKVSNGG